jgi:hypothetical protein
MSKRPRQEDGVLFPNSNADTVVTIHVPVYTKQQNVFILTHFIVMKVKHWQESHKAWHFRHSPCVIFEGEEHNRFCFFGSGTLMQAPKHHNITGQMPKIAISEHSLSVIPGKCVVQNKTSIVFMSEGREMVCPVFDHEVVFRLCISAAHVQTHAAAIQHYQARHAEKAWKNISFCKVERGEEHAKVPVTELYGYDLIKCRRKQ